MPFDELVDHIQEHFASDRPDEMSGEPEDLPFYEPVPIERPSVPTWLVERLDLDDRAWSESFDSIASIDELVAAADDLPDHPHQKIAPVPDVLAFYLPYHFHRRRWGIYLKASGVIEIAAMLQDASASLNSTQAVQIAASLLYEHEFEHFIVETAASRSETDSRQPLYASYFRNPHTAAHEESQANAQAYLKAVKQNGFRVEHCVRRWMRSQGPGYRDFELWIYGDRLRMARRLCARYIRQPFGPALDGHGGEPTDFLFRSPGLKACPIYLLRDDRNLGRRRSLPKHGGMRVWVHSNDHPPPHFHIEMPPGREKTRYLWPELKPYPGDPQLSSTERKRLEGYLERYAGKIEAQIVEIYGTT